MEKLRLLLSIPYFGRASSPSYWKLLVPERASLYCQLKLWNARSVSGVSCAFCPNGTLRASPSTWSLRQSGVCRRQRESSSTILPRSSKSFGRREIELPSRCARVQYGAKAESQARKAVACRVKDS